MNNQLFLTYSPLPREELVQKVKESMSDKRFQHVLRVEEQAIELAKRYDTSIEQASVAALTHDYAKERSDEDLIHIIVTQGFDQELLPYGNAIWHGVVGAWLVRKELGVVDEEILTAIEEHTTGSATMTTLSKIIYVADYIEKGRQFPGVDEARLLARTDLDAAVAFETQQTLNYLLKRKQMIYPKTIETYNRWVVI